MLFFLPTATDEALPDMPTLPLAKLIIACRAFMAPLAHSPCGKTTRPISLSYVAVSSLEEALVAEFHRRPIRTKAEKRAAAQIGPEAEAT